MTVRICFQSYLTSTKQRYRSQNRIHKVISKVNQRLKEIGEDLGFTPNSHYLRCTAQSGNRDEASRGINSRNP